MTNVIRVKIMNLNDDLFQRVRYICLFLQAIINILDMQQERGADLKSRFLHAIANDSPITKLWKFRVFIQLHPEVALDLKEKMLDFALKNKLLGEFEAIYGLFGVTPINIPREGMYDQLKTEMQSLVNKLKIDASQFECVGKVEEQLRVYLKLGETYARYGDHKESEYYFSRILRKQTATANIRDEEYLWQWGREVFYLVDTLEEKSELQLKSYQDLEFFAVRVYDDKKSINSSLAFVRDVYRLSKKGRARGKVKVLENILSGDFSTQDLLSAGVLSLADLGLLYTLLSLAFKDRSNIKRDVKWSSKIEIAYLSADYKKLFADLNRAYDTYGQFNLTIRLIFQECMLEIKRRIFCEIFSAYQTVPVAQVSQMTGIRPEEVEIWVKRNSDLPYLWDPVGQAVVYYQKTVPLYEEAMTFYRIIKEKFQEKQRMLSMQGREESLDISDLIGRGLGRQGHSRRTNF